MVFEGFSSGKFIHRIIIYNLYLFNNRFFNLKARTRFEPRNPAEQASETACMPIPPLGSIQNGFKMSAFEFNLKNISFSPDKNNEKL
jgi:hypothetical protein